jgi:glutathione synthase/RimK-type ligase-like ATP-grasp enzyme
MVRILTNKLQWRQQLDKLTAYEFVYCHLDSELSKLQQTCKKNNIDLLLSLDHQQQSHFLKSNLGKNHCLPVLLPSLACSEMENKLYSTQWFQDNGFAEYLPRTKSINDYPYVVKFATGTSGFNIHYVKNQQQQSELQLNNKQCLIQEYINSPYEYAYHFLAIDGVIKHDVCYQHDFSNMFFDSIYIRGKGCHNSLISRHRLSKLHRQIFLKIASKLNYNGFACIDFKIKNDKLCILEFNSRMGGSLVFYDDLMHDFNDFIMLYYKITRKRL